MRALALELAMLVLAVLLAACATAQTAATNDARSASPASAPTMSAASDDSHWENPDRSCKVDTDCQVKDVGNCCGAHPECVNKDAPTDPAKVKQLCGQQHRAGVCNVRAIGGCGCSQGQCQELNPASVRKLP